MVLDKSMEKKRASKTVKDGKLEGLKFLTFYLPYSSKSSFDFKVSSTRLILNLFL